MQKNGNEVVNVEEDIWDYLESQRLKIPQKVSFYNISLFSDRNVWVFTPKFITTIYRKFKYLKYIENAKRVNMIFWRKNSNKTFLVISNNVEQDILFSMHNFQKKGKVPSTDFPLLWKFEVFFYIRRGETLCTKTLVQKRRRLLWGWRPYYPHMSEWSAYSNFFHKSGKMYEAAAQKFCCVFQPSAVFPSFSITRSWSDIQSIALCIERAEFTRNWKFSTDFWVENPFICFSGFLIIIPFDPLLFLSFLYVFTLFNYGTRLLLFSS